MGALEKLVEMANANPAVIVLPEGDDERILAGAQAARKAGIASPILLGKRDKVAAAAKTAGIDISDIEIIDPATVSKRDAYADLLLEVRKGKVDDKAAALKLLEDPLVFGAIMVRAGDADGTLAGATRTTGDTVRAALQMIGKAPSTKTVSSFFLMVLPNGRNGISETVVFSDCGLVVDPDASQLAEIAAKSAASFSALTGEEAQVGLLSFSTKGSARHDSVTKVADAAALLKAQHPALKSDGELQFDAAFVPSVGVSKAPGSETAGAVNVFIFPNLDAGNIGYKIAQRIGGAQALGPILQGLAKPANDLSRGCNAQDVFNMIAVTVNQVRLTGK